MASGGVQTFRLKQQIGARADGADVVIIMDYKELYKVLKDLGQKSEMFEKEMRKASEEVAQHVVDRAVVNANGQPPHGRPRDGSSGHSQASQVVRGLRARRDRIPTIKLDHNRLYKSGSRSNKSRTEGKAFGPGMTRKVVFGDVFFGAEFGGRGSKKTQQFLRHRGKQGYFFWQAVRDSRSYIAKEYVRAIEDIASKLGISGN